MKHFRIAAALAAALLLAACDAPDDSAWFKVTSFRKNGTTTDINVLASKLGDGATDMIDIGLTNFSTSGSITGAGSGIIINKVKISYQYGNHALPKYEHRVTLYLPPGTASTKSAAESVEASTYEETFLTAIPLATAGLKAVLLGLAAAPFTIGSEIVIEGVTDEGHKVSATGYLPIDFS